MHTRKLHTLAPLVALVASISPIHAQLITPIFSGDYALEQLGSIDTVPTNYGGLTIRPDEPNFLYIGGAANSAGAGVYRAPIIRNDDGFITGFGAATLFASTPNIDGGLVFSPTGTMLFTRYSMNEIGQVAVGDTEMTSSQALTPLGVNGSVGSFNFIPAGFAGTGDALFVSYIGSRVFRLPYTETEGVYTFGESTHLAQLSGGPEGITHVPLGSGVFGETPHVLISAYADSAIVAYELDENGLPDPSTARDFVSGLTNAEGAAIDPVTGDFLFSSFGGGNQVYRVTGFIPEPSSGPLVMAALAIAAAGCARRRR